MGKGEVSMMFKGRFIGLLVVFILISFKQSSRYFQYGHNLDWSIIGQTLILGIVAWWLGIKYDDVKFLSERDILTGVYTRRFIYNNFAKLSKKVAKVNGEISIMVVDINKFKQINDTFGHVAGDNALKIIANILLSKTKKMDIVSRWGGDEFLVLCPLVNEQEAKMIINNIHEALEYELQNYSEIERNIEVSIGLARFPTDSENLDDLIKLADRNMYNMKKLG